MNALQRLTHRLRLAARDFVAATLALGLVAPWSSAVSAADISWVSPTSGTFGQASNWQGGVVPGAGDTVRFSLSAPSTTQTPYTVTLGGDVSTQTLFSSNGTSGGLAPLTIDLQGHQWTLAASGLSAFGMVAAYPDRNAAMTFTGAGTVVTAAPVLAGQLSLVNGTTLTSGAGYATGRLVVSGPGSRWLMNGNFTLGVDQQFAATVEILAGGRVEADAVSMFGYTSGFPGNFSTVKIDGSDSILDVDIMNVLAGFPGVVGGGAVVSNGGTLKADVLTVSGANGLVLQGGTLETQSLTSVVGAINFQSGALKLNSLALGNLATLGQSLTLNASRSVAVSGNTELQAGSSLVVDGGSFRTGTLNGSGAFSFLSGQLEIAGQDLSVTTGSRLGKFLNMPTTRSLVLGQNLVIESDGQFSTAGGGTFSAAGIVNRGQIIVDGFSSDVQAGSLNNSGLVIGNGRLAARLSNAAGGQVRVGSGELMQFAGSGDSSNHGALNILGGTLEVAHTLTNHADGTIAGRGTLIVGEQLDNAGRINISGGVTDMIGDVRNLTGSSIIVSGGSTLTLFDDFIHNGTEFRVSAGSAAVFFGAVSGAGAYTGTGSKFFEGTFDPGNSPDLVVMEGDVGFGSDSTLVIELGGRLAGSEYDRIEVGGELNLGGHLRFELLDAFVPAAGDIFTFLVAGGGLFGEFSSISVPTLKGLAFGILRDADSVSLVVRAAPVPVPAGIWLLGSALVAFLPAGRRQAARA